MDYFTFAEGVLMLTVDKGLAQTLGRILDVRFHELSYNMTAEVENLEDFLEELKDTLNKTFEMCSGEELKKAWVERTKAVRTLLKVVEYGGNLVP
ncbi:hypothetical protein [Pyrococcus kukulkanii]|uniref:Uncharacterized protein n=1 Tax=Pyrococcus kukulkanii TaxID=1609559 RepID=A0ABV4T007_9EURY